LQARTWRVDRDSGDAFTAWKAMGSPTKPTKSQIDRLIAASHMVVQRMRMRSSVRDGAAALELRLPRQGVELIEVDSVRESALLP
jgi:xylan 1,4-beta-xylosidase